MTDYMAIAKAGTRARQRTMMAVDLFANVVAWGVTFHVVGPIMVPLRSTTTEVLLSVGFTVVGWLLGWSAGRYNGQIGWERTTSTIRTLRSLGIITLFAAICGVAFNLAARELIVGIGLIWTITVLGRSYVNARTRVRRAAGWSRDPILIVGANPDAARFIEMLDLYPELGLDPVGVVGNAAEASIAGLDHLYCGPLLSASSRARERRAHFAVIMTGAVPSRRLRSMIERLESSGIETMLSTDLGRLNRRRLQTSSIGFSPIFLVGEGSERATLLRLKRGLDVVLAGVALTLSAPIQILAALAVKLTDHGPVFYRQRRLGIGGTTFELLRFRTMKLGDSRSQDDPSEHRVWDDPRMTRVGRLLEVTGVNEIPQFWNVLRGQLSIVGPKPGYVKLDAESPRLTMLPGLTGLWRTEANLFPPNAARHELDDLYVDNWSIGLDVGVIVASIELIMIRLIRGASWRQAKSNARRLGHTPLTLQPDNVEPIAL